MISTQLLVLAVFLFVFYVLWKRRKYYIAAYKMPGPLGYPIIGIASKFRNIKDVLKSFARYEKMYNYAGVMWVGPTPVLLVADPQIVQDALTSPHCVNRTKHADILSESFGNGILVLRDHKWSQHRKSIVPAFNNKILMSYFPIFNEISEQLVTNLNDYCGRGAFDISHVVKNSIFDLATSTMMGRDLKSDAAKDDENVIQSYDYLLEYAMDMITSPWLKPTIVQKLLGICTEKSGSIQKINTFIKDLIDHKISSNEDRKSKDKTANENNNFINLGMKLYEKGDFTYKGLHHFVITSYETTTKAVEYILMLLAMFPDYQERLYEEIINLYPDTSNIEVTIEDIKKMSYLNMVVNETLRVVSVVPLLYRDVIEDIKLFSGVTVPKGSQIVIDIFNMHRREDIWGPEAHKFNPDNFLPANLEGKHPFAYIPFAKGARNCIGWRYGLLSMKVIVAKLIRNYRFKTDFKFENLEFVGHMSLQLKVVPQFEVFRR